VLALKVRQAACMRAAWPRVNWLRQMSSVQGGARKRGVKKQGGGRKASAGSNQLIEWWQDGSAMTGAEQECGQSVADGAVVKHVVPSCLHTIVLWRDLLSRRYIPVPPLALRSPPPKIHMAADGPLHHTPPPPPPPPASHTRHLPRGHPPE
jgi:hypothetical protein